MDTPAAIDLIDGALLAIDEYHAAYELTVPAEGEQFRRLWDRATELEHSSVRPRLELVRQIAAHVGAEDLPVATEPDKAMYTSHPCETNRAAMLVLRTRLSEQTRMASILGPTGPQLSTSSFHPTIWDAAAHLFDGGHYRQAVQTAGQALESHLQVIAGPAVSGQDLAKVFASGSSGVRLEFADLDPEGATYSGAREGAASLIRGAMMAVRNLVSHPEWPDPLRTEALEMLAVLSYVAHLVDRATPIGAKRQS